jgi:hypothetical protein
VTDAWTHRSRLEDLSVRRFAIHGLALELRCDLPGVLAEVLGMFQPFEVASWPEGFTPIIGTVEPFDADTVARHVSPAAVRFPSLHHSIELYKDGERFWLIDDRWGMTELNLLRGNWRSWLLPNPTADTTVCAETAVVWPLAQLLRHRGLHLLPAVSVARDGWGALILSSFGIEPELSALARNGYQIIGQRWTAVREEDGRVAMLHIPGWVERQTAPRLRYLGVEPAVGRLDLTQEFAGAFQHHAFCDVTLITEPGRRPQAHLRDLSHSAAINVLKRSWPMVDLHPQRRFGQLPPKLALHCRCAELQLSRDPQDLLRLLEGIRPDPAKAKAAARPRAESMAGQQQIWQQPRRSVAV